MSHSSLKPASSQEGAANRPFAMLPHDFVSDQRLSDGDVRVLLVLLYWSRDRADCWPCVKTIGERLHKKDRAIQIALKNLEHFGYVRSEADSSKRAGRRIVLVWKADGETADAKEGDSPRKKRRDRHKVSILKPDAPYNCTDKREPDSSPCGDSLEHQEVITHPSELEITLISSPETDDVASEEPISEDRQRERVMIGLGVLREVTGRQQAMMVDSTAKLIAGLFLDEHSLDFHRLICWRVAKGKLASQIVTDAFVATYDKIVEHNIGVPGSYYHGCLRNLIGALALDEFAAEFKIDRERAKREYACRDTNLIGAVA